ncbi:MAG: hypothetical protein QOG94_1059 [Solirubrobacteraceae bacterium]|nr:hypothetical protein [Solirubrobacteraceae bacterium]
MARIRFAAGVLLGAAVLRLLTSNGLVNYDTLYTLVWGRELAHGTLPNLEVAIAPTPHPLSTLGAMLLSPLSSLRIDGLYGELAAATVVALAYVSLALLGWVVFALGRAWFNTAAGALAAAIVLTRVPVLDFGARAYVDIPYLVLVLGALLVETRRPRAGPSVLALLALAGLLRPEAWLFSAAYLAWLLAPGVRAAARAAGGAGALGRAAGGGGAGGGASGGIARRSAGGAGAAGAAGAGRPTRTTGTTAARTAPRPSAALLDALPLLALAASAPLLWCLHDLLITGNALHSLTGTRDNAVTLGRVTGLQHVPLTLPRRIGEILREPVLLAAAGGGLLALAWHRDRRTRLAVAAGLAAVVAFCVLAAAGLPIITRYVLLPGTLLSIFAGAGAFGWLDLRRGSPQRTWWARFGALALVVLLVYVPSQARRIDRLASALNRQESIQGDLARVVRDGVPCEPVAVPNRRPIPLLALWLEIEPGDVVDAQAAAAVPPRGTYLVPRTPRVARDYILDSRDRDRRVAPAPAGFARARSSASWIASTRC